ncbi:phosphate signaling complex protein PhoU [Tenacibaculum sp.]|nr:phosphate signaling complex protein PhoU [Tenacibaculum sp.]
MANAEYQRELLNEAGAEMLSLCTQQLEKAKESFLNSDSDLAEEVILTETRVNALDLKIEKDCENFLALYKPVAIDLRFVLAIRKINFNLERIGDHAYSISKYVADLEKKIPTHLFEVIQFETMCATIDKMLIHIAEAYENKDVKIARKVFKKDRILDKINAASFVVLENEIKKNTGIISESLLLFSVIKKMERVGDLIKNIAEELIFFIDAEILKHGKNKNK